MPLPNAILRAVMRFGDEPEDALTGNLFALRQELEPDGVDKTILDFVGNLYDKSHQSVHVGLVVQNFRRLEQEGNGVGAAVSARLETLLHPQDPKGIQFVAGSSFRLLLDTYKREVMRQVTGQILSEASSALTTGIQKRVRRNGKWDTVTFQGPEAALDLLSEGINTLNSQVKRGSVEGDFLKEGAQLKRQYERWRDSPTARVGVQSGIPKIDVIHRGLKNGELALVLGFVSHLKTSLCLNWLYRASVWYGKNVGISSLETPVATLRTLLSVIHSSHRKFLDAGHVGLDMDKVTNGALTPEEEAFYHTVIDDLEQSPEYGRIYYQEPQQAITIADIGRWAEARHRQTPLDLLVIDYLGLVDPGIGQSSLEQPNKLNIVIRAAKLLAMTFAQGRGIPILSPFQANREGLKDAEKNGGRYKITALSTANEAERSADLVYYVYLDDRLRGAKELLVGNLKNRNGPLILQHFEVFADPSSRVIEGLDPVAPTQQKIDMDKSEAPAKLELPEEKPHDPVGGNGDAVPAADPLAGVPAADPGAVGVGGAAQ